MHTEKRIIKSESNLSKLCVNLDHMLRFLDKSFNINVGGCCFVASIIAELLEQDDIPFEVAVYYDELFDTFYDIDCSQKHYAIIVNNIIINNDDRKDDHQVYSGVTSEDLKNHYEECGWNTWYDPIYNEYIANILREFYYASTLSLRKE